MDYKILTYEQINKTEWAKFVASSSTGTWFQTPEAFDFYASQPELFEPFVLAISHQPSAVKDQALRAVCCGYVTVEKNPIKQFFTRRAIIIGGPALADDATDEEVEILMKAVHKQLQLQAIYIETRNFNDYSKWKKAFAKAGFEYQPHLNFHVDCTDKERMWERLSDNRKRQLRKQPTHTLPKEKACDLAADVTEPDVREWYQILQELYRTKVKTPLFPLSFFMEAYKQRIGKFLLVKHEGKVIGGSMVVRDDKSVYEWFECGLNAEYKDQYPSVLATWAGMEYAHQCGIARYDMMGAGEPDKPYGVRDFKAEFGGKLVEQGRFIHIAKPMLYKMGCAGIKFLKRSSRL